MCAFGLGSEFKGACAEYPRLVFLSWLNPSVCVFLSLHLPVPGGFLGAPGAPRGLVRAHHSGSASSEPVSEFPFVDGVRVGVQPTGHLGFSSVHSSRRKALASRRCPHASPLGGDRRCLCDEVLPQLLSLPWAPGDTSPSLCGRVPASLGYLRSFSYQTAQNVLAGCLFLSAFQEASLRPV